MRPGRLHALLCLSCLQPFGVTGITSDHQQLCEAPPPALHAGIGGGEHPLLSSALALGVATRQRVSAQQADAYRRFCENLQARRPVRIVALGGSMMAGVDCVDKDTGASGKACAYSARFADSLAERYYGATSRPGDFPKVAFHNRAAGGTTTAGALPQLPIMASRADLVIVDFAVNDRFEVQDWATHLMHSASRMGEDTDAGDKVFAATEAMLRFLQGGRPAASASVGGEGEGGGDERSLPPAVLIVEGYCERDSFSRRAHKRAAMIYGVPFVEYGALLEKGCHAAACGNSKRGCQNTPHPPAFVHEYIKVGLEQWWQAFMWRIFCHDAVFSGLSSPGHHGIQGNKIQRQDLSPPLPFMLAKGNGALARERFASRFKVCSKELSVFDAKSIPAVRARSSRSRDAELLPRSLQEPTVATGEWPLVASEAGGMREDRAAWVTTIDGSALDFPMRW